MPYTNCNACGAKALVGATRCPRCQAPFVSYDIKGERVPTVNCPNCGVQRPVAIGVCPNCLTSTAPAGARLTRGLVVIGLGIALIMAVGYVISRRVDRANGAARAASTTAALNAAAEPIVSRDSATRDTADSGSLATATRPVVTAPAITPDAAAPIQHAPSAPAARAPTATPVTSAPVRPPSGAPPATHMAVIDPATIPPKPAPPPKIAVPDTGVWEFAVANTWVRVRSAPSRESEMLRMVDSAQRVRLGPPQSGWRPVRVGVDRGWVDPRLFTVVPAPRP